jgi:N-formylglutamate amidohydrolase
MLNVGRGFYYTHGYNGEPLRELNTEHKEMVYQDYYQVHHDWLNAAVSNKLDDYGVAYIIDCHSFNDSPIIPFASSSESESPDICIGTDSYHTPQWLTDYTVKYFQNLGYSVEINKPYAGTLISKQHYLKNKKVKGVMIEFNKRLYMDGLIVNNEKVKVLNRLMVDYFEKILF